MACSLHKGRGTFTGNSGEWGSAEAGYANRVGGGQARVGQGLVFTPSHSRSLIASWTKIYSKEECILSLLDCQTPQGSGSQTREDLEDIEDWDFQALRGFMSVMREEGPESTPALLQGCGC